MVPSNAPNRTLTISGASGSGVSYSYRLASYVAQNFGLCNELRQAAPGGLVPIRIDLRDYIDMTVDERAWLIAKHLLIQLARLDPRDELAPGRPQHAVREPRYSRRLRA
jgi:hypothetical protein